jgi:hypothetical protein
MRDFQALQHLKCSTYLVVHEYDELSILKSVEKHVIPSFRVLWSVFHRVNRGSTGPYKACTLQRGLYKL